MTSTRKSSAIVLSAIVALALLSVGFASWEIRNISDSTNAGGGSISADTVVDKRLKILDGASWNGEKICFGYSKGDTTYTDNGWLTVSTDALEEDLSATYSFKVACPNDRTFTIAESDFQASETGSNGYWTAATSTYNYIDATPTFATAQTKSTETSTYADIDVTSMDVYDCTVTITFTWGSHFSLVSSATTVNPYVYYNSQVYTDVLAEEALVALRLIKNVADNVTFSFTITVSIADSTATA